MSTAKIAITLDTKLLAEIDLLVSQQIFTNRSRAIQEAMEEKLARLKKRRLAAECAKLNPQVEQALAEEGMEWEKDTWPEY